MFITLVSLKGGVGKTTSALHIATYLARARDQKILLMDNDPNQYALNYSRASEDGKGLPFDVFAYAAALNKIENYDHVVIDSQASPADNELMDYAEGCDLLVVPTTPASMPLTGLGMLAGKLGEATKWRTLLTMVPPHPVTKGADSRKALNAAEVPIFAAEIPRSIAFDTASEQGVPISELGARGRQLWANYEAVGREIDAILEI